MDTVPGYEQLQGVLQAAMDQAAKGKGAERHANDLPFHQQPMQSVSDMLDSDAGLAFQAIKKIREGRCLPHDPRERELLGAIVYIAGMVIFHRRNREILPGEIFRGGALDEPVAFAFDEARIDRIAASHGDGEHYTMVDDRPGVRP